MLDQLSNFSDRSEATDRNVEEIIKEAEEIIDKSSGIKLNEIRILNSPKKEIPDANKEIKLLQSNDIVVSEEKDYDVSQESPKNEALPVKGSDNKLKENNSDNNPAVPQNLSESDDSKHNSNLLSSSGSSINHIKLTIDSLKQFSNLVEQQFNNASKAENSNKTKSEGYKETDQVLKSPSFSCFDSCSSSKSLPSYNVKKNSKKKITCKANENRTYNSNKPTTKALNCFERLYQDRPLRLSNVDKKNKIDLKNSKKPNGKKSEVNLKDSSETLVGKKLSLHPVTKKKTENKSFK